MEIGVGVVCVVLGPSRTRVAISTSRGIVRYGVLSSRFSTAMRPSFRRRTFFCLMVVHRRLVRDAMRENLVRFYGGARVSRVSSGGEGFLVRRVPYYLGGYTVSSRGGGALYVIQGLVEVYVVGKALVFPFYLLCFAIFIVYFRVVYSFFYSFGFFVLIAIYGGVGPIRDFFLARPFWSGYP